MLEGMTDLDMAELMKQAQQMREQMEYLQKGLAEQTTEGSAGAGMVKVTMTGDQRVTAVEIDPSVLQEDREMVQDLIVAAVNNALEKSKALAQERLGSMLPPGMMPGGMPGL
jgi:DNA-binding YbaB/EbfC family protein